MYALGNLKRKIENGLPDRYPHFTGQNLLTEPGLTAYISFHITQAGPPSHSPGLFTLLNIPPS